MSGSVVHHYPNKNIYVKYEGENEVIRVIYTRMCMYSAT